jgi:N-acetylglucosamine-6-phosphate deacetylase
VEVIVDNVTVLINGKIITPIRIINEGIIVIEAGVIKDIGPADLVHPPDNARVIDVKGDYIAPGFIDLHLHGAWGGDVMAASVADLGKMARGLVKNGVTSFLPSSCTGSMETLVAVIESVGTAMKEELSGAKILGVHLEGPYFSLEQKGAQNPRFLLNPQPEDYLPLLDKYPYIIRVSAAPELPGALELGQELKRRKIVASIAHSDAIYQEVLLALENGYTHVTHMFSGMSGLRRMDAYRVAGVIESTLLLDELTTEIIADGHHLPPSLMRLVLKAKGLDKVCLITDSMMAAGLGPGKFSLGGLDVIVEASIPKVFEVPTQEQNYVAKLLSRDSFASSVSTMDQLVRNMVVLVGLNVQDAVKMATVNPARMQGLDTEIGILAKGMKADIVVFDSRIGIKLTIINGEVVYQNM